MSIFYKNKLLFNKNFIDDNMFGPERFKFCIPSEKKVSNWTLLVCNNT